MYLQVRGRRAHTTAYVTEPETRRKGARCTLILGLAEAEGFAPLARRFSTSHDYALGFSSRFAVRWLRYHAWVGKQHTMLFADRPVLIPPFHKNGKKHGKSRVFCRWRRRRDSNPRGLSPKRFSRPPRYDRFDTPPHSGSIQSACRSCFHYPIFCRSCQLFRVPSAFGCLTLVCLL